MSDLEGNIARLKENVTTLHMHMEEMMWKIIHNQGHKHGILDKDGKKPSLSANNGYISADFNHGKGKSIGAAKCPRCDVEQCVHCGRANAFCAQY